MVKVPTLLGDADKGCWVVLWVVDTVHEAVGVGR